MFSVVKHGEGGMGSKGAQLGAAAPLLRGKLTNDVVRRTESFGTKSGAVGGAFLSFREDVKDGVALAESSDQ